MLINDYGHSLLIKNNNSLGNQRFKLPITNVNAQTRNYNKTLLNEKNIRKYSLYSTKEATPRKEYKKVILPSSLKTTFYNSNKEKCEDNDLDDSVSQISKLLNNNNNKNLNYSGLMGKIPGTNNEENFVYDQMLYNKRRTNKAKILSHKIGVLKLPISNISTKEALTNSSREKKCFSDRSKPNGKNKNDDIVGFSCCFFGK